MSCCANAGAAIAVDSTGHLNIAWGMHNVSLNYAISSASVMGATFTAPSFNVQTASNAPTLFPSAGSTTNEATYPDFYNIPGSSDLLFAYRNGGAGGGPMEARMLAFLLFALCTSDGLGWGQREA